MKRAKVTEITESELMASSDMALRDRLSAGKAPDDPIVLFNFRVPESLRREIRIMAITEGREISDMLREALVLLKRSRIVAQKAMTETATQKARRGRAI